MSRLFIAEKPSLAKAIAEGLSTNPIKNQNAGYFTAGNDRVTWCFGHMLEQVGPEGYDPALKKWSLDPLPVIPEQWKLAPKESAAKQLSNIQACLKWAGSVVNAGDADREGQLLVDEILEYFHFKGAQERIWVSAMDKVGITRALSQLKSNTEYNNLRLSALARSRADWLIGINLTRAYTVTAQKQGYAFGMPPITIGRVKTPVLALIVQRELEIKNFKPIDHFVVHANIKVAAGEFMAKLRTQEGMPGCDAEGRLTDQNIAKAIVARVNGATGVISKYETKRESTKAPLPFNLSSLQIYANSRWGLSVQKVLDVCQSLYETHALTSYPRSDCEYLPEDQLVDAPTILRNLSAAFPAATKANLSLKSRAWDNSKVSAHHGIIPTSKAPNLSALTQEERDIYEVICLHYIAQFYPDFIFDKTNIESTFKSPGGVDVFTATGRVEVSQGWKVVIPNRNQKAEDEDEGKLPQSKLNEPSKALMCKPESKQTKPPKRFNEGTLVEAMTKVHQFVTSPEVKAKLKETDGLGTEATRASIIQDIINRKMVKVEKKFLVPTEMGFSIVKAAPGVLKDPGLTAVWESGLEKISKGEMQFDSFMDMQAKSLVNMVTHAKAVQIDIPPALKAQATDNRSAPSASASRSGSAGTSSGFQKRNLSAAPSANAYAAPVANGSGLGACPGCGKPIVKRTAKTGPNVGKEFLACSGFPVCKQKIQQPAELAKAS